MSSERIDVTYKLITPLFCGGAGGETAELRLPSVKGVLRWWWRALAWVRERDLAGVKRAEDDLFGSAGGGQSKVSMRLVPGPPARVSPAGVALRMDGKSEGKLIGEGARYFGYGAMGAFGETAGKLIRGCLMPPLEIKLELRATKLDRGQRESLLQALRAMGLLGGFGAKSRKGYGSLVLHELSTGGERVWIPPASLDALKCEISELLVAAATGEHSGVAALPPYTAVSARTRVLLVAPRAARSPLELLDLVGRELMRYRSWGHRGTVLGQPTEANFRDDHDLMKKPPHARRSHPRRIVFGLPHNYGKQGPDQVGPADPEDGDRRASPLLVHVHMCGETPVAVLSFLPAVFLSRGDAAMVNVGGARVRIAADDRLWEPIETLLARFLDPRRRDKSLGPAVEVLR